MNSPSSKRARISVSMIDTSFSNERNARFICASKQKAEAAAVIRNASNPFAISAWGVSDSIHAMTRLHKSLDPKFNGSCENTFKYDRISVFIGNDKKARQELDCANELIIYLKKQVAVGKINTFLKIRGIEYTVDKFEDIPNAIHEVVKQENALRNYTDCAIEVTNSNIQSMICGLTGSGFENASAEIQKYGGYEKCYEKCQCAFV